MIIKKNSQKYREVVKPKVVQKSVEKEPVVEESFSPEITYPQTSEEVEEDNDDDFQAQPQENLPKEPEIDLFEPTPLPTKQETKTLDFSTDDLPF